jgi:hypothetical protein
VHGVVMARSYGQSGSFNDKSQIWRIQFLAIPDNLSTYMAYCEVDILIFMTNAMQTLTIHSTLKVGLFIQ